MNKRTILASLLAFTMLLSCCGKKEEMVSDTGEFETGINYTENMLESDDYYVEKADISDVITLNGDSITSNNNGVKIDGSVITVTKEGTYSVKGSLKNGQIIIDAENCNVNLILDDVDITCKDDAPIFVKKANKAILSLATGSNNTLTDGSSYNSETEATATIYSKSDLTINGDGKLAINANFNNAIQSKDGLKIVGGELNITSVDDGIIGKDYVYATDGNIIINASGDGLKSTNDSEDKTGYVHIEDGKYNITSGADAIQSKSYVYIKDGEFSITTAGGSENSSSKGRGIWAKTNEDDTSNSAKGIKATTNIQIEGGTFNINSSDDAIHSNEKIGINDGKFVISSGDDGIHADTSLAINGGDIDIKESYEGIESASILIGNGNINIVSKDDGINVAGGKDSSSLNNRLGMNNFNESSENGNTLYINGGNIFIDAAGDGIDVNGSAYMSAGNVVVNGPTNNGNGALDYDKEFKITGGELIASGSSGMMQSASKSSTQNTIAIVFETKNSAGTVFEIKDSNANTIISTTPTKAYESIVISSGLLNTSKNYNIYIGGELYKEVSIEDVLTTIGKATSMSGGGKPNNFEGAEPPEKKGGFGGRKPGNFEGNEPPKMQQGEKSENP